MSKIFLRWLVNTIAIALVAWFYNGLQVANIIVAVIVALMLGLVNTFIRPVLFLLTLPITIVTLGLFTFVLNGFLLWGVSLVVPGFHVNSFFSAVVGSILISLVSMILGWFVYDD